MNSPIYDAAVVGGGLAGCSAAITLAQQGRRVVLFESKHYPHHKVCGEFLSPECARYLHDLGLTPALRALCPPVVHSVAIIAPDGTRWETHLRGVGFSLSRYRLDQALAQQSRCLGVDLHEGATVTRIDGDLNHGFELEARSASGSGSFSAAAVIVASGKRSSLDRALNRSFLRTPQPYTGLKAHFRGAPLPGRVDLYTFPGGYCGLGEVENGLTNVCLLVRTEVIQRVGGVEGVVEWMQAQNPGLKRWFKTAEPVSERWLSISQVPFLPKPAVEGDILIAGDAAGLIAPLTGDGMSMALRGGQMAARYVQRWQADELNAGDLPRLYAAEWKRTFDRRLWLGRRLQACLFQPRLLSLGLRILNRLPAVGQMLVDQTREVAQPGQLAADQLVE